MISVFFLEEDILTRTASRGERKEAHLGILQQTGRRWANGHGPSLLEHSVWTSKVHHLCLGVIEEEPRGNPSGLAAKIYRAAPRSRIYISNCDAEPEQTRPLQTRRFHTQPHRTKCSFPRNTLLLIVSSLTR